MCPPRECGRSAERKRLRRGAFSARVNACPSEGGLISIVLGTRKGEKQILRLWRKRTSLSQVGAELLFEQAEMRETFAAGAYGLLV